MPICARCGEDNPAHARFCLACGGELEPIRRARKIVTLLLADIVSSSRLAAAMDSEAFSRLVGRFFAEMRTIVERHGGTVSGYAGDEMIAAFGLVYAHEDDAVRAVRAACEMRARLQELNEELASTWRARVRVRIGINTGEVALGESTDERSVLGEPANVAAGLQKAAEPDAIVISDSTHRLVRLAVDTEPVTEVTLKGKADPVPAYVVTGVRDAPLERRVKSPMVGRETELILLSQSFELVTSNSTSQLATVLGEPGVGKSRLSDELVASVGPRAVVYSGRCLPYGDAITYWPIVEVVEQAAEIGGADTPEVVHSKLVRTIEGRADSDRVADRIAQLLGAAEKSASQEEIFWAVRRFLEIVAEDQPVIVIVDDIHWAEPLLLDLIEYVVGASRSSPLFFLCLARPELLETRRGWGGGKPNAASMLLHPLADLQSAQLLDNLVPESLPPRLKQQVLDAAGGNPLFIEETVAMLLDEGRIDPGKSPDLEEAAPDLPIPPTIHALLTARLELLDDSARRVLQLGAVMGKVFPAAALEEALPTDAEGGLAVLAEKDFVLPIGERFAGADMYMFRHLLIRDAAYRQTPKAARADAHEWYATWLRDVLGDRLLEYEEIIGYHLEQAFRYSKDLGAPSGRTAELGRRASQVLSSAAQRAVHRGDLTAAGKLLSRADDVLPRDDPGRAAVLAELSGILQDQGKLEDARSVLTDALELATGEDDRVTNARVRLGIARLDFFTNPAVSSDAVKAEAEVCLAILEEAGDLGGAASACYLRSLIEDSLGRASPAEGWSRRAIELAEKAQDWTHVSIYKAVLLRSHSWGPTPFPNVIEEAEDLLRWGRENDHLRAVIAALRALARGRAALGDFRDAREASDAYRRICEELELDMYWAWGALDRADAAVFEGDLDGAEADLRESVRILESNREVGVLSSVLAELANVAEARGESEEAEKWARYAAEVAAPDDFTAQVGWRRAASKLALHRQDVAAAERLAREAVSICASTEDLVTAARALVDLASVLVAGGNDSEAAVVQSQARDLYARKGVRTDVAGLEDVVRTG